MVKSFFIVCPEKHLILEQVKQGDTEGGGEHVLFALEGLNC